MSRNTSLVYSATYSNVPVYEFNIDGNHVMRRRHDDYINATHILKVAGFDKPARTRILEREVQKGVHEKVQGGYGKYQGTFFVRGSHHQRCQWKKRRGKEGAIAMRRTRWMGSCSEGQRRCKEWPCRRVIAAGQEEVTRETAVQLTSLSGTWIPLEDGKALADRTHVVDKLMPIFDYEQGEESPPPAPKHQTQQRPKATKAAAPRKRDHGKLSADTNTEPIAKRSGLTATTQAYHHDYDQMDMTLHEAATPDDTLESESQFDDYDGAQYTNPRKRKRVDNQASQAELEHSIWADELLDYFVLQDNPMDTIVAAPVPPANASLNRPIDDRGHTALHWAAAMADLEVVKDLIRRGANIDCQAKNGETPLMRAVVFTNNFDRRSMEKLAGLLVRTVNMQQWSGATVFHHIANITESKKKYECARYYIDCLLNKMAEVLSPDQIERILNEQDAAGDTAVTIAARHGARKCVRSLIGRNAALGIPNLANETADSYIRQLNQRRQERSMTARQLSSSPFQGSTSGGAVQTPGIPFDPLLPHSSILPNGTMTSMGASGGGYKSDSALAMSTQVLPLLTSKNTALALAFEGELAEKDTEVMEAERVLTVRRAERELLQRQQEEIRVRELEESAGGQMDEQLFAELLALERECEGLTREEEDAKLATMMSSEVSKLASPPHDEKEEQDRDGPAMLHEKLTLARELASVVRDRAQLSKDIVKNLSVAGVSAKSTGYRILIVGALGVTEADVENMLPEIVNELEEGRAMEAVGA